MNRVFKIIWNKTTQRQEVVSELAKSSAKASSASNNTQKATKQFIISILTVLITSTLLASVSNAATINYNDIPKQGVAVVSDHNSEILKNVALEGSETLGVLSAIDAVDAVDAVGTLNLMMKRYKGFVHVNAEGYKKGTIKDDGTTSTENTVFGQIG
ncbi:TPA: ESPR-type extended signal peptide-containing protein [Haemophilus influenzae]